MPTTKTKPIPRSMRRWREVRAIQSAVAAHWGLSVEELLADGREEPRNTARQIAMYFARKLTKCSSYEIAGFFGKKDHWTIIHGAKAIEARILTESKLAVLVAYLETKTSAALNRPLP